MTALPKPDDLLLDAIDHKNRGVELKVCGVVQGVGFRPFVYRLANEFGLTGTVANSGEGVVIRLAPPLSCLDTFVSAIKETAPPLARITEIEAQPLDHFSGQPGFAILSSETASSAKVLIPPDVAVCEDCLQELFSPANQRYRYPFINCTNCGPRFTIVDSVPYDRPKTSMKVFPMCTLCEQEYHDIANRRFHAQPNACWQCGPRLSWHDNAGQQIICDDPVRETAVALERGSIVAMRGLGGFHLAVDAANEHAVAELRRRKNRKSKPLAVMVKDVASARMICAVSADEEKALLSHERPIVLLPRREGAQLAPSLAPGISHVGVMLPYTPYHDLFSGRHHEQDLPF